VAAELVRGGLSDTPQSGPVLTLPLELETRAIPLTDLSHDAARAVEEANSEAGASFVGPTKRVAQLLGHEAETAAGREGKRGIGASILRPR
jgi:hypothetical protein